MMKGENSVIFLINGRLALELGNSIGQKEAALQVGTIKTPLNKVEALSFRSVGIIFEMGGQSQRFSLSQEWAKASTPKVLGQIKSEKNLSALALEQSAKGSRVKGPNLELIDSKES